MEQRKQRVTTHMTEREKERALTENLQEYAGRFSKSEKEVKKKKNEKK